MKKILLKLALLGATLFAYNTANAQTVAVTGDLKTMFNSAAATKTQVCFSLTDGNGNQLSNPRTSSGVIVPTATQCVFPDGSGHISTTVIANDQITPSNSIYSVTYTFNGRVVHGDIFQFALADGTENLNTKTSLSNAPVVSAPTGDTTYARLDGGNSPFTGNETFNGNVSVGGTLNGVTSVIGAGCAADGVTNATACINTVLAANHAVTFAPLQTGATATFLITCDAPLDRHFNSGGLLPQSNSIITGGPGVTVKCAPNSTGTGVIFRLKDLSNVTIKDIILDGNRTNVTAGGGTQYIFGVGVWGSTDVILENITAQNFWGDGFYFDEDQDTLATNLRVKGSKLRAFNNRRNGASFLSVTSFKCTQCSFESSNGTAPQDGVDIEPGGFGTVKNWECDNCDYLNNQNNGLNVGGFSGLVIEDVRSIGGKADGNCVGSATGSDNAQCAGVKLSNHLTANDLLSAEIADMTISNNGPKGNGIYVQDALDGTVVIHDNKLYGNGDSTDSQAVILTSIGVDFYRNNITSLPGISPVAVRAINDNSNTRLRLHENKWCNSSTGTALSIFTPTNNQYVDNYDCANDLNIILKAEQMPGADIGAGFNKAFATAGCSTSVYCTITISGLGTYNYSTDFLMTAPAHLRCEKGVILNYTGSGNYGKIGPDSLTISTYNPNQYEVDGCTFTGGTSAAEGLFVNLFAINVHIHDNFFHNVCNVTAYQIWLQGENWDSRIHHNKIWADSGTTCNFNGIAQNAADPANGASGDNGQSQGVIDNNLIQNVATHSSGVGIYVNGTGVDVHENTIEGLLPNIQLGAYANGSNITQNRMEVTSGSGPCISYGDSLGATRVANYVDSIHVLRNKCNVHNADFSTTAHFIGPQTASTGMEHWEVVGNEAYEYTAAEPLIIENNSASQIGNIAHDNLRSTTVFPLSPIAAGKLHTAGGSITAWGGTDENLNVTGTISAALYASASNCSSSASPAVCSSAPAGSVVIAVGATSVVVNTTAVTANSQIKIQQDNTLGTKLGVTCNTTGGTLALSPWVLGRSAGVSFTTGINAVVATNPVCLSYFIIN